MLWLRQIGQWLVAMVLQVLLINQLQLGGVCHPFIYILPLLMMPITLPCWADMLIGLVAGLLMDVIRKYAGRKPMLGVCLGHQAIGEAFGAKLTNLSEVYHGVATPCTQFGNDVIFDGLDKRIEIGRYHSWVVDRSGFPDCLDVTAVSDDGCIMGLKHKNYDIHGIQFHPESVLTPDGKKMVKNWLEKA